MFNDESADGTCFKSQLLYARSPTSRNIQTTEVVYSKAGAQSVETRSVETQTTDQEQERPQVDYKKLATFLRRVSPAILEALDEAYGDQINETDDSETHEDFSVNPQLLGKINIANESSLWKRIASLSWSAGGGTLAISHSVAQHETWCEHLSKIALYDFTKDDRLINDPNVVLETDSCVTAISFHPTESSVLAAGLSNGDVLLWNLRDRNSVTPIHVCAHHDSVSKILWVSCQANKAPMLASAAKDGYVLLNELFSNFTTARSYKRLKISKDHNPAENSRPRSAGGSQERAIEPGLCITSFDFSSKDPIFFIAATLCGGVYKCSIDRVAPIEGDRTLVDPVVDEYERHDGTVTCINFSKIRNLFLTSSTDKEIRMYDFNQHPCLRTIVTDHTIMGLTWMVGNADIFAAYGASPTIKLYNVASEKAKIRKNLEIEGKNSVTSLRINAKRGSLAMSDGLGVVEIWKIPRNLF